MTATIISKPVTPPTIAQVQQESELLEQMLRADIHEHLINYAHTLGISPFQALNQLVLQSLIQNVTATIKARYVLPDWKQRPGIDKLMNDVLGRN